MNVDCVWTPFGRGFVFWEPSRPEYLPPDDDAGRLEWLEGFCQAHADYPADGDFESGKSAAEALDRLLAGHPAPVHAQDDAAAGVIRRLLMADLDSTLVESGEKTPLPGVHGYRLL